MFKKVLLVSALVFMATAAISVAKDKDDFCPETYQRVLNGEKSFIGAKLEGANFKNMDLSGADFRGAELDRTDFKGANLTNVNFENADLDDANLKGANVNGAIFKGAELEYAIWTDGRTCAEGSIGGCW